MVLSHLLECPKIITVSKLSCPPRAVGVGNSQDSVFSALLGGFQALLLSWEPGGGGGHCLVLAWARAGAGDREALGHDALLRVRELRGRGSR